MKVHQPQPSTIFEDTAMTKIANAKTNAKTAPKTSKVAPKTVKTETKKVAPKTVKNVAEPVQSLKELLAAKTRLSKALEVVELQLSAVRETELKMKDKQVVAIFKGLGSRLTATSVPHEFRLTVDGARPARDNAFKSVKVRVNSTSVDLLVETVGTERIHGCKIVLREGVHTQRVFTAKQTASSIGSAIQRATALAVKLAASPRKVITRMVK